ncbi:MAG: septum formation family protein, partial [Streptosporangiaceae bacterium]
GPASVATGRVPAPGGAAGYGAGSAGGYGTGSAAGYGGAPAQDALPPLPYANQAYSGPPGAGPSGRPGEARAGEQSVGEQWASEPRAGEQWTGEPQPGEQWVQRAGEHRRERGAGRRRRPRWLWAAGAVVVVCAAVVVALVVSLSSRNAPAGAGSGTGGASPAGSTAAPGPAGTLRTGDLAVAEFRVGDCLTGSNMQLDTTKPWPKLTTAVSCSRPHTAEVFFADNTFWSANSPFPGASAISKDGNAACDSAFRSYVGVALAKSIYTWTNVIPDAATWPTGDRALHCIAYYATPGQPAGVKLTGSIKDSRR